MHQSIHPPLTSKSQGRFLKMLPAIRRTINRRLRRYSFHDREELAAEAIANSFVMYRRLVDLGRGQSAYATPLAQFGVRRALEGRPVGSPLNVRDISSRHCQTRKSIHRKPMAFLDSESGDWEDLVVEDRRASPADIAVTRIDFSNWLTTLSRRYRRIAETLAIGESTAAAAKKFRVTPGRISQIRRELLDDWRMFQGEPSLEAA